MSDHDDLPYIVIERRSGGATPFLWGALIGAGAALLMTPRTGEQTQAEIRDRVARLRTTAEGRVGDARSAVDRTRGRVEDRLSEVREQFQTRADQVRHAMDAGRQAAHDTRAELERRIAQGKAAYRSGDGESYDMQPSDAEVDVVITEVIIEEEPDGMNFR